MAVGEVIGGVAGGGVGMEAGVGEMEAGVSYALIVLT